MTLFYGGCLNLIIHWVNHSVLILYDLYKYFLIFLFFTKERAGSSFFHIAEE